VWTPWLRVSGRRSGRELEGWWSCDDCDDP
jgi:hypothetical protein